MPVVPETLECLHCGVVGDATLTTGIQWRVINNNDVLCKYCWFLDRHPDQIEWCTLSEADDMPKCSRCGILADPTIPHYWMEWYAIDNKDVCKVCWKANRNQRPSIIVPMP